MEIIPITKSKGEFFKILATTDKSQVGVMTLDPDGDSGPEDVHTGDQIIYVIEGTARIVISGEEGKVNPGEAAIIPAGAQHHIYSHGKQQLFFLTVYSSPQY
jgi:mannose-6-phosphate isomerase-like protein (cupin superfamily)